MKLRYLSLLLPLCAGVAQAAEPLTGAYAGVGIGRAALGTFDLFGSDFEAHGTGFKALIGYRILNGLAVEASYTDYGKAEKTDARGVRVGGEIDAFSIAAVGLIPLRKVDLFGKVGLAASDGSLRVGPVGQKVSVSETSSTLGIGLQYRRGQLALRGELEALALSGDHQDFADWASLISVGVNWRF